MIKRCSCGGLVSVMKKSGRYGKYNGIRLEIPENIAIPTCQNCGEEYVDEKLCRQIDAALKGEYNQYIK